jgi:hypothetical protein
MEKNLLEASQDLVNLKDATPRRHGFRTLNINGCPVPCGYGFGTFLVNEGWRDLEFEVFTPLIEFISTRAAADSAQPRHHGNRDPKAPADSFSCCSTDGGRVI